MMPWLLLCISLILIFFEFYAPGGVLALIGSIVFIGAWVIAISSDMSFTELVLFILISLITLILTIRYAIYRIKKSSSRDTLMHSKDQEGYQGAQFDASLIGRQAVAYTDLRPSGFIIVDDVRIAATCQSGYVEKGSSLKIIGGDGAHVIVKHIVE